MEASDTPLDLPNIADYIAESVQARVDAAVAEMTATLGDLESWKAERSRLLQEQLRAVDALPRAVPNEPESVDLPVERPVSVRCVVVSPFSSVTLMFWIKCAVIRVIFMWKAMH